MDKTVLWISPYVPYDTVEHAGGKVHNFYIKKMQELKKFDITLLTMCLGKEWDKIDLDQYGIKNFVKVVDKPGLKRTIGRIKNAIAFCNPIQKYGKILLPSQEGTIMEMVKHFYDTNKEPDIIILQWTMVILLLPRIKKMFPNSKIIAIEEDVTYLKYKREYKKAGKLRQNYQKYLYLKVKNMELEVLSLADLVVVNNEKDKKLLKNDGFNMNQVFVTAPYYDDYSNILRSEETKRYIIFWGAMGRIENEQSVLWFMNEVMPFIKDENVKFLVVGSNPSRKIKKRESERIGIIGYVRDVSEYFAKGLCLVAPLQMGAGIKIKILEAFSAGIPVLTNHIGIEGIPANPGKDYLHCETAQEYIENIEELLANEELANEISRNAREFMKQHFKYDAKLVELADRIESLI